MADQQKKQPIIKLDHVDFWYDKGKQAEFHALRDVSFEIFKGDYVAFFGPSGSGKSSLLYLISGVEQSQAGKIVINGRDISTMTKQELAIYRQVGVGMVFQSFNLIPSLTVLDNVALPMSFLGIGPEKGREEAAKLLERVDMSKLKDRFPYELSGGQQQRVGIARALANNPPIIIADEPVGNLDSKNANLALDIFKEMNEKDGRTVIIVTHEAWSIRDARRVFHIKDGVVEREEDRTPEPAKAAQQATTKIYENLSPEKHSVELAARTLSNVLLEGFSMEEVRRFEFFLNQRFGGNIDKEMFQQLLNKPYREGGVGLWRQRAEKIAGYVDDIIMRRKELSDLYAELQMEHETPLKAEVERIRQWLTEDYKGKLSSLMQLQLDELVEERIKNIIDAHSFRAALNAPKKSFGLGLSFRTSQKIGEKMELILGNSDKIGVKFA